MTLQERLEASIKSFHETQQELQQLANKSQELNSQLLILKGSIETLQQLVSEDSLALQEEQEQQQDD